MTHRTTYHPTETEILDVIRDTPEPYDYLDTLGQPCEDEEENQYARALGYNPEII